MVWLPGLDEKPFSLARPAPATMAIARVGPFSQAIHALRPGDRLWIRGPLGHPFQLPESAPGRLLLIGGGYGVAPLHFLAERARATGWPVDMVIGARTAGDLVFVRRFEELGARVTLTTDDGSAGLWGAATDAAMRLLDEGRYLGVYACGPEPMLDAVERLAQARRLPAQLSYERYMRCGFGVCGSCAKEGWLVCKDGPVKRVPAPMP